MRKLNRNVQLLYSCILVPQWGAMKHSQGLFVLKMVSYFIKMLYIFKEPPLPYWDLHSYITFHLVASPFKGEVLCLCTSEADFIG